MIQLRTGLLLISLFLLSPLGVLASTESGKSQLVKLGETPAGLSSEAWQQIQAQIQADRYAFSQQQDKTHASNARLGMRLELSQQGALLSPSNASNDKANNQTWQLGLRTHSLGRMGNQQQVSYAQPTHQDSRADMPYISHPGMSEWYVNGEQGFEQGWTLNQPPAGKGDIQLHVAVNGFHTEQRGENLRFVRPDKTLNYDKLQVFDASGKAIVAQMHSTRTGLQISFSDVGAKYPITVDPLITTEAAKLVADDAEASDLAGWSVALDGTTALVGARGGEGNSSGSGSVYVFTLTGGTWSVQDELVADDGTSGDQFGHSVSLSGNTALVGANRDDENGQFSGSAYVFTRTGELWEQQQKLMVVDTVAFDEFGISVSLDGDTALIGANNVGDAQGAAYVFVRTGEVWNYQATLTDGGSGGHKFGSSVGLQGNTAAIGAVGDDGNNPGSGAVYVFTRTGESWGTPLKITALDGATSDNFGRSLALDGDTLLVGAAPDDGIAGAAYVFIRSGMNWGQQSKLIPSDAVGPEFFGFSVALDGDTALVGTPYDTDGGDSSGAAYVFTRSDINWTEQTKLIASDAAANKFLGIAVALEGDTAFVGAPGDSGFMGATYLYALTGSQDYGDAPDPTYPTFLINDGARHTIAGPNLGVLVDADADGQPNGAATGDDADSGSNDEDGVFFSPAEPKIGEDTTVTVTANNTGPNSRISGWIDFNQDGVWDSAEQFADDVDASSGSVEMTGPVLDSFATVGTSYARFRICEGENNCNTPTGEADTGEVEDYELTFAPGPATPDAFDFNDKVDVPVSKLQASNVLRIFGNTESATIRIDGPGEYITANSGGWTSGQGVLNSGDWVKVRHTSAATPATTVTSTIVIGGRVGSFSTTTGAVDGTPEPFDFDDQGDVPVNKLQSSNVVRLTGFNVPVPVSLSGEGEYITAGNQTWRNTPDTLNPGEWVKVRHISSSNPLTTVNTTLDVGGETGTFSSTTGSPDLEPDAFDFVDKFNVLPGKVVGSNVIRIKGINFVTWITIDQGEYITASNKTWRSTPGQVNPDEWVKLRHISAVGANEIVTSTVTIGGVVDTFSSTTAP